MKWLQESDSGLEIKDEFHPSEDIEDIKDKNMDEDSGELEDKMKDKEEDDEDVEMEHQENNTENTFTRGDS